MSEIKQKDWREKVIEDERIGLIEPISNTGMKCLLEYLEQNFISKSELLKWVKEQKKELWNENRGLCEQEQVVGYNQALSDLQARLKHIKAELDK